MVQLSQQGSQKQPILGPAPAPPSLVLQPVLQCRLFIRAFEPNVSTPAKAFCSGFGSSSNFVTFFLERIRFSNNNSFHINFNLPVSFVSGAEDFSLSPGKDIDSGLGGGGFLLQHENIRDDNLLGCHRHISKASLSALFGIYTTINYVLDILFIQF